MTWQLGVAWFFGGAFLANAIPHLVAGVAGTPLQTPFASPPFKGLSPPAVNVAWGMFNLVVAYVLLGHVGDFDFENVSHAAVCFAGFGAMSFQCARAFGRLNRG